MMMATDQHTDYFPLLLGALELLGIGAGLTVMPIMTLSLRDVPEADSGLGSGMVQVSQQLPAVFGLAVLSTIATARSDALIGQGGSPAAALVAGYHLAYLICAACVVVGAGLAMMALRKPRPSPALAVAEAPQ